MNKDSNKRTLSESFSFNYLNEINHSLSDFKKFFECDFCYQTLESPIALACGKTVCKKDLDFILKEMKSFKCIICNSEHFIPKDGFKIDEKIQNMLENNINKINLKSVVPLFKECDQILNMIKADIKTLDDLVQNPKDFLYEYFNELKRQADLRREKLKIFVDSYSDEVMDEINKCEIKSYIHLNTIKISNKKIIEKKKFLADLYKEFNAFDINDINQNVDIKLKNVLNKAKSAQLNVGNILKEYQQKILNNKLFKFEFLEISMEKFYGVLTQLKVNFDSDLKLFITFYFIILRNFQIHQY
jgi:hypothetical protein